MAHFAFLPFSIDLGFLFFLIGEQRRAACRMSLIVSTAALQNRKIYRKDLSQELEQENPEVMSDVLGGDGYYIFHVTH
jgi:hypothetical protein